MASSGMGVRGITAQDSLLTIVDTDEYWVEVRYRKNFYKNWLFYQVTPGLTRPREFDFETLPRLELKLEAVYGDLTGSN